jgi:hypothetical protein
MRKTASRESTDDVSRIKWRTVTGTHVTVQGTPQGGRLCAGLMPIHPEMYDSENPLALWVVRLFHRKKRANSAIARGRGLIPGWGERNKRRQIFCRPIRGFNIWCSANPRLHRGLLSAAPPALNALIELRSGLQLKPMMAYYK